MKMRIESHTICHPELVSGSQTVNGKEIPKQVRNDKLERDFRVNFFYNAGDSAIMEFDLNLVSILHIGR